MITKTKVNSPDPNPLPPWSGQGFTLLDRVPYLKPITRALLTHALMVEAARTSETSVKFYQITRRNNPDDIHLHTRSRENLKSQI
jgi:hypothetical protein